MKSFMRKFIAILLALMTIGSCIVLSSCSSSGSSKPKYSYYDRSDGKRIWVKN